MPVHQRYPHFVADQRQFFDELITEDWDAYSSAEWDFTRRFEIARLFDRIQPRRILDVGCGCGFHDCEMAKHEFVEQVDAVDYSAKSIEQAERAYSHPKVRRWVEDFLTASPETAYDLVVSFQVFEHLDRPDAYLAAAARHVAPDGCIAIFTPNRRRLDNLVRRMKGQAPILCDPMHHREYTSGEIAALARPHGLVCVGRFGIGLPPVGGPLVSRWDIETRTWMGYRLPWIASGFCVLLARAR